MTFMKKTKTAVACLLSVTLLAGMTALTAFADEAANANRFEAEDGVLSGSAAIVTTPTAGADVSGGAFVGSIGQNGGFVDVTVVADAAGEREVIFCYCSFEARSIDVSVNGGEFVNIPTQGNGNNWNGNVMVSSAKLYLNAGENVITIGCINGWAPNVDYVELGVLDSAAMAEAVAALVEEAEALPAEATSSTAAAYESVVNKYKGLTDEQKALLTDEQKAKMDAASAAYDAYDKSLDQLVADQAAAAEVKALVDAIGEVTADSEAAVTAARSAYDKLTDSQKTYVSPGTLNLLTRSEAALKAIKNPAAALPGAPTPTANSLTGVGVIVIVAVVAAVAFAVVAVVVARKKK